MRSFRPFSLSLAIALLVQLLLPFYAVYNAEAAQHADSALGISGKVLLCTIDGYRWVSIEELQKGEDNAPKPHPDMECGLCFLSAHGLKSFTSSAGAVIPATSAWHFAEHAKSSDSLDAASFTHLPQSRAPPELLNV